MKCMNPSTLEMITWLNKIAILWDDAEHVRKVEQCGSAME